MKSSIKQVVSKIPVMLIAFPTLCFADVGQMMNNLQSALLNVLAPVICVCGVIYSGTKLAMGDESAKRMLLWSCIGTVITFTAPSIMAFLRNNVAA